MTVSAPQPPSVPKDLFGGHFRSMRRDPTGFLSRLASLGDVTTFWMGPQRVFLINHPDLIRDLLVTSNHKFVKGIALQRARNLLGNGLLTSEGSFHLKQRRMIQPAFHRDRIGEYAKWMVLYGEKMAARWRDGCETDVSDEMMRLTLWIVAKTLFDADVEDEADEVGRSMTDLVEMFDLLLLPFAELLQKLPLPHSLRLKRARRTLDAIIFGIIEERRRSGEDKGDLLSMLLTAQDEEDGSGMDDVQLRDECLTLFLAGHETTANALIWTLHLLSENPDAERKLHREIDEVIGSSDVTPGHFSSLKWAECVIAESMRLFPPAWTIGRLAVEDHRFGGFHIPKGSLILASQYVLHRDDRFWDEPDRFMPERWQGLSVREAGQAFTYFPFSKGVRSCIGEGFAWMEAVLLLVVLCRRWRFEKLSDQKIGLDPKITLRPKFGMRMRVHAR